MKRLLPAPLWLMLVLLVLCAFPALAHEGFPDTTSATVRRDHPEDLIVGATFGALISRDTGKSWRWICTQSLGYGGWRPETYLWAANGDLMAVTGQAFIRSHDGGCTWQLHPYFVSQKLWPIGLASPPATPSRLWVVTTRSDSSALNGIYRSDDGGETFQLAGLGSAAVSYTAVKFAPSDPRRLYVTANTADGPHLYRSDDEAATWEDIVPSLPTFERRPYDLYVLRVSETDPNRLWARISAVRNTAPAGTYYYVLESKDGGRTFTSVAYPSGAAVPGFDEYLIGIEVSADGNTVWVATPTRFFRSNNGEPSVLMPLPDGNACVQREGAELLVCGADRVHGWVLASTMNGGDDYTPIFALKDVQPPACPAGTPTHDLCRPLWPSFASSIGADPTLPPDEPASTDGGTPSTDGGSTGPGTTPDAGTPGTDEPQTPPQKSCGCTSSEGWMPLAGLLALATFRRSRRHHPET